MWVTQSYITSADFDSKLYVYYLFEDYNSEQVKFTKAVEKELETIGEVFENSVSLFIPNERYTASIEKELRSITPLWEEFAGKLPGLLICTQPLSNFDIESSKFYFKSLAGLDTTDASKKIKEVKKLLDEQLLFMHKNSQSSIQEESMLKKNI